MSEPRAPWTRVAWKGAFALGYAALLTWLLLSSDIYRIFRAAAPNIPIPFIPNPFGDGKDFLVAVVLTGLTLLPFLSKTKELPALLTLAGVVSIITSYTYSTLDWSRLLKEFGLTQPGFPPWSFLLVSAVPYFLALALQFLENGRLLRENFEARGVPPEDVRGVREANLHASLEVIAVTAACFLVTASGVWVLSGLLAGETFSTGALAAPLVAGALLGGVLAAYLWWPRREERRQRKRAGEPPAVEKSLVVPPKP